MSRLSALKPLGADQAAAADPEIHAALSASAGTGKTQVLTARVLRLLLGGAAPETILCLTFTKAAAAEMAERIGARLARWVRLDELSLSRDLAALGLRPDPSLIDRARNLFAIVLDCPGGLAIQTIHSFCQSLLAAFPAEAGISPGFRAIEGREEDALVERTLAALAEKSAEGDGAFLRDLEILSGRLDEKGVRSYLRRCAASPEGMARFRDPEAVETDLRRLMDLPAEGDIEALVTGHCADERFDCSALNGLAAAYRNWGTPTAARFVAEIEAWLSLPPEDRCRDLPRFARATVLTGTGSRRSIRNLVRHWPDGETENERLCGAIEELLRLLGGDALARLLAAGLRAGSRFTEAYAAAKRAGGLADFDDLIRWSRDLLASPGIAEWVRFKLDRRTDHLLVDEAQDTNAAQWAIVRSLVDEYFAGQGARGDHRTLFMVGDFKQAIYGFQGTDPAEFKMARDWARDRSEGGPVAFRDLSINRSFRSSQAILDLVDAVLDDLGPDRVGLPDASPPHQSFDPERFGAVELWPAFTLAEGDGEDTGEERWEGEERRRYATHLADWIASEIRRGPLMASTGRPLGPGDIIVLVRSRASGLASLLVARLFERGVRTAGIDRLTLSEPLAVKDLLAAVGFAVQPLDDLTLANLLVSPLIGWSQDDLYLLARARRRHSLWEELGRRAGESGVFAAAREELTALLNAADLIGPHDFLERILSGPLNGRRKLLERLGRAARDPINELLAAALEYESQSPATLQGFLTWFGRGEVEVKRDPEGRGNAVRIMTVHGAKGLEAPLVILADATANPADLGGPQSLLTVPSPEGAFPVIRPRKAELRPPFDAIVAAEQEADLQEHFRLLYVALTRAGERLIVSGLAPSRQTISDNSWHATVQRAMQARGVEVDGMGVMRLESGAPPTHREDRVGRPTSLPVVPPWALALAPAEARPPQPLAPSQLVEDREGNMPPSPDLAHAALRGRLLHALFERLPATRHDERRATALRWLRLSADLTVEQAADLVDAALLVIEAPEHADWFSPDALAEAPLAATLPDGTVVAGTVDRLRVTAEAVHLLDFKTGRHVPADLAAVPAAHCRQMQLYGQALATIFPDRRISLALLYTEGPRLIDLPLEASVQPTHMAGQTNQEPVTP